ncbi:hypothetical protein CTI12_AA147560 [Artemisia annua]|uniref:Uncharacterized protein n=1 Tax=Artemisia annua TaxID=35608 RepID=A0A2U1PIZ8_ARTAN|nr:hypothetical protein CTI12_AA147560 [Artemisia annua]
MANLFGKNRERSSPIPNLHQLYARIFYAFEELVDDIGVKGAVAGYYYRIPSETLDVGLYPLRSDEDVMQMLDLIPTHREIEVYVELKRRRPKKSRKCKITDEVPMEPSIDPTIDVVQADTSFDGTNGQSPVPMIAGQEQQAEDEAHIIDEVLDGTDTSSAQPHLVLIVACFPQSQIKTIFFAGFRKV